MAKSSYTLAIVWRVGLLLFCMNFLSSCDKTEVMPRFSSLNIQLKHVVDENDLLLDPINYINEAGNDYSVTDLMYFLSNVRLVSKNGVHHHDLGIYYVNYKDLSSLSIQIDSINPGFYDSISFDLGIDAARNLSGYLPNTIENINMAWPVGMGGGYHFLKFEGKFMDGTTPYGFAFHIGKSEMIIHYSLPLKKNLKLWNEKITLKHNVSEWFKNPLSYDFLIHEPYSMSSDSVMHVLQLNGADIFSL